MNKCILNYKTGLSRRSKTETWSRGVDFMQLIYIARILLTVMRRWNASKSTSILFYCHAIPFFINIHTHTHTYQCLLFIFIYLFILPKCIYIYIYRDDVLTSVCVFTTSTNLYFTFFIYFLGFITFLPSSTISSTIINSYHLAHFHFTLIPFFSYLYVVVTMQGCNVTSLTHLYMHFNNNNNNDNTWEKNVCSMQEHIHAILLFSLNKINKVFFFFFLI